MTNYEENLIVTAVNEYSQELPNDIKDIDEALDYLTYDKILNCLINYYVVEFGTVNYKTIKYFIEEFYEMTPKSNNGLNIY